MQGMWCWIVGIVSCCEQVWRGGVSGGESDLVYGEEESVCFVAVCECSHEGIVI